MEKRLALPIAFILSILLVPLASAQSFLESEELISVMTFLFFFAIVYITLNRMIPGEQTIIGIVSFIITFFITRTLSVYLEALMEQYNIMQYVVLFLGAIALLVIIKLVGKFLIKLKPVLSHLAIGYCIFYLGLRFLLPSYWNKIPSQFVTPLNILFIGAIIYFIIRKLTSPERKAKSEAEQAKVDEEMAKDKETKRQMRLIEKQTKLEEAAGKKLEHAQKLRELEAEEQKLKKERAEALLAARKAGHSKK